jgi:predicted dehydrogenase
MKLLIIGLGSMGKRRARNLMALGLTGIAGFDPRADRRQEAEDKYGIRTLAGLSEDAIKEFDTVVISTPPDMHNEYIGLALEYARPCFVEASVILEGLDELNKMSKDRKVLVAPSCTMRFHPTIKTIKGIVNGGEYGKITNFTYHFGQYLPDWHPWEDIRDFYVGKKETGGAREIVPFELTWLTDITGMPEEVFAFYGKTLEMGVDIDDSYNMVLKYDGFIGSLVVDVVSRFATRSLILNLEKAQLRWDWNEKVLRVYEADKGEWVDYREPEGRAEAGYNVNIIEEMYVEEMRAFIDAAGGGRAFPNTLDDDMEVLGLLEKAERTNRGYAV